MTNVEKILALLSFCNNGKESKTKPTGLWWCGVFPEVEYVKHLLSHRSMNRVKGSGANFHVCVLSLATHFHANPFRLCAYRGIFLEQLDFQFFDGREVVEDAFGHPLTGMFQ